MLWQVQKKKGGGGGGRSSLFGIPCTRKVCILGHITVYDFVFLRRKQTPFLGARLPGMTAFPRGAARLKPPDTDNRRDENTSVVPLHTALQYLYTEPR